MTNDPTGEPVAWVGKAVIRAGSLMTASNELTLFVPTYLVTDFHGACQLSPKAHQGRNAYALQVI